MGKPEKTAELEFRIGKLDVKEGDIIVVKFDMLLCTDEIDAIKKQLFACIPSGVKVMVIDRLCSLQVLSLDKPAAHAPS